MNAMPEVAGVSHRWVEARGVRFHVAEAGAGGDPVLLLHGWPQHWHEWRHLMPDLADRHRVLALDLRGFGWSDAPPGGYLKEEMANDVLAVLDALGLERVKLVGHDWGGWIGFLLCLREPRRFERFLALGIVPPWIELRATLPHAWRFWYQQVVSAPGIGYLAHRRGRFVRFVIRHWATDPAAWDEETIAGFADSFTDPAHARAAVLVYRNFALREAPAILRGAYADKRLAVPTRLLFGDRDVPLHPALLSGCERRGDALEVELVPGAGHFLADERPDVVADRARALFGG
jgi:pimeloyl-ACP methyl ester carboxylesterase